MYTSIKFTEKIREDYLSVIIPVYKDVEGLKLTLTSLFKQEFDKGKFEILVGNDGSDTEVQYLCKKFQIPCLSITARKGSYNARNEVMKKARGEFIAFIDAGTVADRQWVKLGMKALKKDDYVGGFVKIIKNPNENILNAIFCMKR